MISPGRPPCGGPGSDDGHDEMTAASSDGEDGDPFDNIPSLSGFQLLGVRSAFSRAADGYQPSPATQEHWKQIVHKEAITVDPVTSKKAGQLRSSRLIKRYTQHSDAAVFSAPAGYTELGLASDSRDAVLVRRKQALGATGHAVCAVLDNMHRFIREAACAAEKNDLTTVKNSLAKLQGEDVRPLGHALRIVACEYQAVMVDRRDLCLNTLRGQETKRALEQRPPSDASLFEGDLLPVLQAEELRSKLAKSVFNRPSPSFNMFKGQHQQQQQSFRGEGRRQNGGYEQRSQRQFNVSSAHGNQFQGSHTSGYGFTQSQAKSDNKPKWRGGNSKPHWKKGRTSR